MLGNPMSWNCLFFFLNTTLIGFTSLEVKTSGILVIILEGILNFKF